MSDVIEAAKTGRSKCRGCGARIEKGQLRFGEAVPNPFADEADATTSHWFHVECGADKRAAKFATALAAHPDEVPERERLLAIAQLGVANPELNRVLRAERSPSGRARCRHCRELIENTSLRVAIEPEADPMSMTTAFFVHAACAAESLGELGLIEKLERVSKDLDPESLAELRTILTGG